MTSAAAVPTGSCVLGQGAYGCVKKVDDSRAVKIMDDRDADIYPSTSTITEVSILRQLIGTRNCGYLLTVEFNDVTRVTNAYIPLGDTDLYNYIKKRPQPMANTEKLAIMRDVTNGVKELHVRDIVHLDLKPQNVIRTKDVWKIVDFGLAFFGPCFLENGYTDFQLVTQNYRPPEIQYDGKVSFKVDIYSLGLILLHIGTDGRYLDRIYNPDFNKQLQFIDTIIDINTKAPRHPFGPEFMELIAAMLNRDALKRPSIEQVINSKFFGGTESYPNCQNIIRAHLTKGTFLLDKRKVREYFDFCEKVQNRHATFFCTLQLSSKFNIGIDKYVDYISGVVNKEQVIAKSLEGSEITNYLIKMALSINLHTPYSLLFSIVGENEKAIGYLYKMAVNYTDKYVTLDPEIYVDAIVDYVSKRKTSPKVERLKQEGVDLFRRLMGIRD